ncbi:tripartite tricarboxylate transporter TctB family protein [Polycladidibacter hongkongensis]|uniref:tripartite tricarboxylate transporter TctB family protein n=1 Tax=Polycladidibacter hongkongensis TaxID=1647556 RepID=UPI0008335131|nr:tripartite tricarboxylate transporter TctB family protein [Pseudovibrio hongkongensis]
MKLDDIITGGLFAILGLVIVIYSQSFPTMRHIAYGPGFFPSIVGVAMIGYSGVLILRSMVLRWLSWRKGLENSPLVVAGDWVRSGSGILDMAAIPASVIFYILLSDSLGFYLTCFLLVSFLNYLFSKQFGRSLFTALVVTTFLQLFFGKLMMVPLPWGFLEPYSGVLTWM